MTFHFDKRRSFVVRGLLIVVAAFMSSPCVQALTLAQFTDCIGSNVGSYGLVCQLNTGTYGINSTLVISRNPGTGNILTVKGTYVSSLSDTTLQRTATLGANTLMSNVSPGHVTIWDFTFDGNRGGISGYRCLTSGYPTELDLQYSTNALVTFNDFMNSPGTAINSGSHATFQYNIISKARIFGIRLGSNNTYYSNYYEYVGTNAVDMNSGAYMAADYFYSNHDEFAFGNGGGTLWIDGTNGVGATNIVVTDTSFVGNNQHGVTGGTAGPFSCVIPGTPTGVAVGNVGIEARNTNGVSLINNTMFNHRYQNIYFDSENGGATSGGVLISTYSTYCPSCSAAVISSTYLDHGIDIEGNVTATVTFDGVQSEYSAYGYGIRLAKTGSGYTAVFLHNACLVGNDYGRFLADPGISGTPPSGDTCPSH